MARTASATRRLWQALKFRATTMFPSLLTARAQLLALRVVPAVLGRPRVRPATRFVVLTAGRTGSDLLVDLLNSHPEVHCDGEILSHRLFVISPLSLLAGASARAKTTAYGFKLKVAHLQVQRIPDAGEFLRMLHDAGWRIIHLRRRNILRAVISGEVARRRKALHHRVSEGPVHLGRFRIDPHLLLQRLRRMEATLANEERALGDLPRLTISYEDDLQRAGSHQRALDRAFAYLGLPRVPVQTRQVRLTPDHLAEFIENHDEIVQVLSATKYAGLLAGP